MCIVQAAAYDEWHDWTHDDADTAYLKYSAAA